MTHALHGRVLCSTVNRLDLVLEGLLRECERGSVAKSLGRVVGRTTSVHSVSVGGGGGTKLNRDRDRVVDEDVDANKSSKRHCKHFVSGPCSCFKR